MSDKNFQQISLLNFDPKTHKEPIITSPRSVEACRRQGIDPSELLMRSVLEMKEMSKQKNLDKADYELLAQHYEEKRKEKVRVLLEERNQVIEDEKNGLLTLNKEKKKDGASLSLTKSSIQNLLNTKTDSTIIEKEKKQLQRIQQKQEKEIKTLLEYEQNLLKVQKKQEEKKEQEREKERLKEIETAKKRREAEEKKRLQELEKQKKFEELEEMKRIALEEARKKDEDLKAREHEKEMKRHMEIHQKEEEQRKKHEEFLKKTDQAAQERQQEILQKKEEMDLKDRQRQEYLREQIMKKAQEAEERRKEGEERLRQAKEKNDELLMKKKNEFDEKQSKNEEKRKLFELERQRRFEEDKRRAEQHAILIKKVLEDNAKQMEGKKDKYLEKEAIVEEKKREHETLLRMELEKAKELERIKEEQRKQVKNNMETRLKDKVDKYLELMDNNEQRVLKAQQAKEEELRKRQLIETIKRDDKIEFVRRRAKMDDYRRQKILEKIEADVERGEKIKQDRAALLEMRQIVKKEMQANKQSLLGAFERAKKAKLSDSMAEGDFHARLQPLTTPTANKSVTHFKSASKDNGSTFTTANLRNKESARKSNGSVPVDDSQNATKRNEKLPQIQQPQQGQAHPQPVQDHPAKIMTEKDARKGLEDLKMKQNQDMLRLLEDEHNKEVQRDAKLRAIEDLAEKKKVEKTIAADRAKSQAKVQQLSSVHEDSIKQFMSKYGLKA